MSSREGLSQSPTDFARKWFVTEAPLQAADKLIQIHGADGCNGE